MGSPRLFLLAFGLFLLAGIAWSQEQCQFANDCGDCISLPGCFWCSKFKDVPVDVGGIHCLQNTTAEIARCDASAIENPQNSDVILQNDPLSKPDRETTRQRANERIVQLQPQHVKLKLRQGVSQKVEVKYRRAYGYPIDLYYLMDLSYSMRDDKEQLASLGGKLTSTLQSLTKYYRVGFGSFVDKVLMPYISAPPDRFKLNCAECAQPYSFRNDLPLQPNGWKFAKKVREARISGNTDPPEGAFDALMQAIVCKEQIGWRDQARRIIVLSTDAQFHQAGDGKLAGVVVPNDGKCHLNDRNEYDAYDRFDYPSVGQINQATKDNDIYVIFAVSDYEDLYREVTKVIENSSYGKLATNSRNVVDLVRKQYEAITSFVTLSDNSSDTISIAYSSKCKDITGQSVNTSTCSDIREGDEVSFTLDVKLNSCPKDRRSERVEVKTLQDTVILDIEFQCDCNCDKEDPMNSPSDHCSGQGSLVCGVCSCPPGYRGDSCQCKADGSGDLKSDLDQCKAHVSDTDYCSGKGYCVCGACQCYEEDFTGKFCHCNSRKCRSGKGEVCSNRGTCSCEQCNCVSGYTGRTCECPTDDACRMPGQQEICSAHGECKCGKCICNSTHDTSYSGQYCEDCLTCEAGRCSEFKEGVLCRFHDRVSPTCNLTVIFVDSVNEEEDQKGVRLCTVRNGKNDCMILFTYRYIEASRSYVIHVQNEEECPEEPPIMAIVFGILAGIVLIGLLTLVLWRILTWVYDRKEYAKFLIECDSAQWNTEGNPIYKNPSNTFENPVFAED